MRACAPDSLSRCRRGRLRERFPAPAAVGTHDFEERPLTVQLRPRRRPAVCSWVGFASRLFTSAEGPAHQRNEHVDKDPDGPAVPH